MDSNHSDFSPHLVGKGWLTHFSGSGRVDYLCMDPDGRTEAWLRSEDDPWFYAGQVKFTEGLDRANFRFADADG
ncbi:hypothetical protein IMZ48_17195 [Candidatus Bathyarchaeota archaeon]|nr:hypothetical protein [Candidatus Bathyarchaeota archaeon]